MTLLQLLWLLPLTLMSVAGLALLRWVFRGEGAWKQPRAWALATMVVIATLLGGRALLRASPPGKRELLERHSGLALPFWPSELTYRDDAAGTIVASLRLMPDELAKVPRGESVTGAEAQSLLADARQRLAELPAAASDAQLESLTRCHLGWYSVTLVDRGSERLWMLLFYPSSSDGALPCIPN